MDLGATLVRRGGGIVFTVGGCGAITTFPFPDEAPLFVLCTDAVSSFNRAISENT
jgi:hypothetical protein